MDDWYAKYYSFEKVFGDQEAKRPGFMTKKYCMKGHIMWTGKVLKGSKSWNKKAKVNESFLRYLEERGKEKPTGYGMAQLSSDACFKSFAKYDRGQPSLREALFERAWAMTEKKYYPLMGGSDVLSEEEALAEMDMTSSCGYPGNLECKNKREWLGSSRRKALLTDFYDVIGGNNPNQIVALWKVAQKRELLPDEKIKDGKVRTFTASSIEFSVAANRLFVHQNLKMNESNMLQTSSSTSFVGGNKFGGGWHRFYKEMDVFKKAYALDKASFDASCYVRNFQKIRDFRVKCWKPEYRTEQNKRRADHIYGSIVNSVCVLENLDVLVKDTGNPSGSTNTINDNTLILDAQDNYAWLCECEDQGRLTSLEDFEENVKLALNGDDDTYTVSEIGDTLFSGKQVAKHLTSVGFVTKTDCWEARELKEVDFLSQWFVQDQDSKKWYPCPKTNKVLCSLLYASETDDVRWHYLRACALRIDSFWNLECRSVLDDYIVWMRQTYRSELCGTIRDLTMKEIFGLYMSDSQLYALYSGKESWKEDKMCLYSQALKERDYD